MYIYISISVIVLVCTLSFSLSLSVFVLCFLFFFSSFSSWSNVITPYTQTPRVVVLNLCPMNHVETTHVHSNMRSDFLSFVQYHCAVFQEVTKKRDQKSINSVCLSIIIEFRDNIRAGLQRYVWNYLLNCRW